MEVKKGSMTVEAVLVVPLCLFAVFVLLLAGIYLHHRSWYSMAALSCVYAGTETQPDLSAAAACWEHLKETQYFPVRSVSAKTIVEGDCLQMRIEGKISGLWGIKTMTFQVKAVKNGISPPQFLRRIRQLTGRKGG